MPEFAYKARTTTGEDVAGSMTASSRREMVVALSQKSLFPIRVEVVQSARPKWQFGRRVKAQQVATCLTQLADLLRNGVPMLHSLEILAEQAPPGRLVDVLADVRDHVTQGSTLDEAFARHPRVFNELTISMVRAGSEGAFLEDALKRTADFLELQEEIKARLLGAMVYPAILATAGFVVTTVLIVFFVPKFAELFERLAQEGGGLPTATVVLLWLSDVLRRYGLLLAVAAVGGAIWLPRALRTPRGRELADRAKLKLPVAGKIFLGSAVSRFCRVLGTLLHNGVPLLKALRISSDSAGNVMLSRAIRDSAENVSAGETLSGPLAACGLIPRAVMAMISVAEESNNLDEVLINVADSIDRKTSRQLDMMVRLVEPALLLVMGGVILFVMVALLLPVFEMSATMA